MCYSDNGMNRWYQGFINLDGIIRCEDPLDAEMSGTRTV